MYEFLLILHSWLRWGVLLALVAALALLAQGAATGATFEKKHRVPALVTMILVDVQLLVGILLYGVFSPLVKAAHSDMAAAMKDPMLRFFAVEHVTIMVVALVLIHVGWRRIKKRKDDASGFKSGVIFYGIALVAMVLGAPWAMRPLFRL